MDIYEIQLNRVKRDYVTLRRLVMQTNPDIFEIEDIDLPQPIAQDFFRRLPKDLLLTHIRAHAEILFNLGVHDAELIEILWETDTVWQLPETNRFIHINADNQLRMVDSI